MVKRKLNITMDEIVYKKLVELAEKAGLSKSAVLSVLINDCYEKSLYLSTRVNNSQTKESE